MSNEPSESTQITPQGKIFEYLDSLGWNDLEFTVTYMTIGLEIELFQCSLLHLVREKTDIDW